jgi:hypothetical protein
VVDGLSGDRVQQQALVVRAVQVEEPGEVERSARVLPLEQLVGGAGDPRKAPVVLDEVDDRRLVARGWVSDA